MEIVCPINISSLEEEKFKCLNCNKCDKLTNQVNNFKDDLLLAENFEIKLKEFIEKNTNLFYKDLKINKNPDLSFFKVYHKETLICRIEAKFLQGKAATYMKNKLKLEGKESLVIDEPKLLSYINRNLEDNKNNDYIYIPTFIVWYFGRPCEDFKNITIYQEITELKEVFYNPINICRFYERKSSENDFVDNKKLGVTKKFHFSIKETKPIYKIIDDIFFYIDKHEEINSIILKTKEYQNLLKIDDFNINEKDIFYTLLYFNKSLIYKYLKNSFEKVKEKESFKKYFIFEELFNKEKIIKRIEELK